MSEPNIEELLQNLMGSVGQGAKDAKLHPWAHSVTSEDLYQIARQQAYGLLQQPTLTAEQVTLLTAISHILFTEDNF